VPIIIRTSALAKGNLLIYMYDGVNIVSYGIPVLYVLTLSIASLCRVAWLIGWALILEYTIGGSAVARGISPNLVSGIPLRLMMWSRSY
jgi:hypothetical protein